MDEEMQFTVTCGFNSLIICNFGWHNPVLILKRLESEGSMNDGNPFDASRWRGEQTTSAQPLQESCPSPLVALACLFASKAD